jgi:outer membrane lipoprotein-sorting protein
MFASRKTPGMRPAWDGISAFACVGCVALVLVLPLGRLSAQSAAAASTPSFPDTEQLMKEVMEDQKKIESLLSQYTFTDKVTVYSLDKNWTLENRHTDVYYITPTAYEFFSVHISHDGKEFSGSNLSEQEKKIEKRMKADERKAQKNQTIHPKDRLLFADIIARSKFTPTGWDSIDGWNTVVYSFEPKSMARPKGELLDRIAGDLKGKMWISPEEKEVVRIQFTSVAGLGMGVLGNVKGFSGVTEQRKFHGELWMPVRQEYTASGRELFKGFHVREVSEFSDYLKATTDVFQQVRTPPSSSSTSE